MDDNIDQQRQAMIGTFESTIITGSESDLQNCQTSLLSDVTTRALLGEQTRADLLAKVRLKLEEKRSGSLSQRVREAFVGFQTKMAVGTLQCASDFLRLGIVQMILPQNIRTYLLKYINDDQIEFRGASGEKRLVFKFWITFLIFCAVTMFLLWKFGVIDFLISSAKTIISTIKLYVGKFFAFLSNKLSPLLSKVVSAATKFFNLS